MIYVRFLLGEIFFCVIIVMVNDMKKSFLIVGGILIFIVILGCGLYNVYKVNYDDDNRDLDLITYDIPSEFEKSEYGVYYHYYGEDNISCSFHMDSFYVNRYLSGKSYLENNVFVYLSDEVSEIKEVNLNGDIWYSFYKKNGGKMIYYYATVKDNLGYYFEYGIDDYENGDYEGEVSDFCYSSLDKIISSIRIK